MFDDETLYCFSAGSLLAGLANGGYLAEHHSEGADAHVKVGQREYTERKEASLNSAAVRQLGNFDLARVPAEILTNITTFLGVCQEAADFEKRMLKEVEDRCPLFNLGCGFESQEEGYLSQDCLSEANYEPEFTTQQKIKLDRLNTMLNTMKEKVIQYLEGLNSQPSEQIHRCKLCSDTFTTGRQLGGHMSRKHPGRSDTYNSKRFVHKFMKCERARREYFRRLAGKLPNGSQKIEYDEDELRPVKRVGRPKGSGKPRKIRRPSFSPSQSYLDIKQEMISNFEELVEYQDIDHPSPAVIPMTCREDIYMSD